MKKNGFTLVELLAVIVILGIIGAISVTVYNSVKYEILQSEYENIIYQIETEASNYAFDEANIESVFYINVESLIEKGYLTSDENGDIENPLDGSSLNCYIVTIKYVDGEYVATFDENLYDEECEVNNNYYESNISIDGTYKINNNSEIWYYGENITLSYKNSDNKEIESYYWSNNLGGSSIEEEYVINIKDTLTVTYYLNVKFTDNTIENLSVTLNIDNESPDIYDVSSLNGWSNIDKEISVSSTDYSGSGVESYYYSSDLDGVYELYESSSSFENGEYYIYSVDYCGNQSDVYTFDISNVDKTNPEIMSVDIVKEEDVSLTFIINDDDSGFIQNGSIYAITTDNDEPSSSEFKSVIIIPDAGVYYVWTKDTAGNISDYVEIEIVSYTYEYDNGDNDKTIYYLKGGTTFDLESPIKENYNFVNWTCNNEYVEDETFSNLSGENFFVAQYNYDDMDIQVASADIDTLDLSSTIHVVFVLDESGSISTSEWDEMTSSVEGILTTTNFTADSIFSIVTFGTSAESEISYSNSVNDVMSALGSAKDGGVTNYEAGLSTALTIVNNAPEGFDESNTYVIFFTDGVASTSVTSTTLTNLKSKINSLYVIGIGINANYVSTLKSIATTDESGDAHYAAGSFSDLVDILSNIAESILKNEMYRTTEGKYELANLVVAENALFTLTIDGNTYEFTSMSELEKILTIIDDKIYLNLAYIDYFYGIENIDASISIIYYYN